MADTTDTPTTDTTEAAPATPRRRGPRKADGAAKTPTTRRPRKSAVQKAEETVTAAASNVGTRVKRGAAKVEQKAEEAAASVAKAVKPRASARAKPPATAARKSPAKKPAKGKGGKWGSVAIAGGVLAVGATAAALLTLKGSAKGGASATPPTDGAHQPDGKDSSKSFDAGIADENTIPETTPGEA